MKYLGAVETARCRNDFYYEDEVDCYWIHWLFREGPTEDFYEGWLSWFETELEFAEFIRTLQFDRVDEWDLFTPILDQLDVDLEAVYEEWGILAYMQKPDKGDKDEYID